jgi:hypothetical protein
LRPAVSSQTYLYLSMNLSSMLLFPSKFMHGWEWEWNGGRGQMGDAFMDGVPNSSCRGWGSMSSMHKRA